MITPMSPIETLPNLGLTFILDCNIWLDWLLFNDSAAMPLKTGHSSGHFRFLGTAHMRSELLDVLSRQSVGGKFVTRSAFPSIEAMMSEYDRIVAIQIKPDVSQLYLPQCKDKDDQMFIDLAIVSKATLVSKDRHILAMAPKLKKQYGVQVIHPRKLLSPA
jgi:putative PIN family toxin of toxin-antitoxin system